MSTPVNRIENAALLTDVFGYWPSFHDAELLELHLHRKDPETGCAQAKATIHVFKMTDRVSPDGYFVCEKHSVVTLAFSDIEEIELDGFNHQNALDALVIKEVAPGAQLRVSLESAYGVDGTLVCNGISVVSVVPGIPEGSVYVR